MKVVDISQNLEEKISGPNRLLSIIYWVKNISSGNISFYNFPVSAAGAYLL